MINSTQIKETAQTIPYYELSQDRNDENVDNNDKIGVALEKCDKFDFSSDEVIAETHTNKISGPGWPSNASCCTCFHDLVGQ